jgi:hypothetical protein
MDEWGGTGAELCYECHVVGEGAQNIVFCSNVWEGVHDIFYSEFCVKGSHDLFGCEGLSHAKYCILNKQYSRDEYFVLREKIIAHMKKTEEWGEFFPTALSSIAYNETVAQEYFPLTKEEVLKRGWKWKDENPKSHYDGVKYEIPNNIEEVKNEILNKILTCEQTGKNYRIVKPELEFYRKMKLPIPRLCPDARHEARMKLRNPRQLWTRKCDECGLEIQTSFAPDRPERILCEKCYLKIIN